MERVGKRARAIGLESPDAPSTRCQGNKSDRIGEHGKGHLTRLRRDARNAIDVWLGGWETMGTKVLETRGMGHLTRFRRDANDAIDVRHEGC